MRSGDVAMNCEEFEMAGLDLGSEQSDGPLQRGAREHLLTCSRCASLHENWQTLRGDLRELGAETREALPPSRVEMRLRQEFRTKHKTLASHRFAAFAGWGLAAAALILGTFTWMNWKHEKNVLGARVGSIVAPVNGKSSNGSSPANHVSPAGPELGETLVASNDAGDFTLLPGTMPGTIEDAMIVHVQMQRSVLGSLGLTVSEDRAADWIQVDLLVGDDGQPQAVRLPESTN
jgi:predicted anti-sigma-YlaC factor YlaD